MQVVIRPMNVLDNVIKNDLRDIIVTNDIVLHGVVWMVKFILANSKWLEVTQLNFSTI